MRIAIMQGRLLPPSAGRFQCFPRDGWRDEFPLAAAAGLGAIEWIYDLHGADVNPIAADDGVASMKALSAQSGVVVRSLCADYFMDLPLLRVEPHEIEIRPLEKLHHCELMPPRSTPTPNWTTSSASWKAYSRYSRRPASSCTWRPRSHRIDSRNCWRGCRIPCSRSTTTRATVPRSGMTQ